MPVTVSERSVTLSGVVSVEDTEPLAQWLRATPRGSVRMGGVTHLHTAALQVLLAARPRLAVPPADPFLARWVTPLLTAGQPTDRPTGERRPRRRHEPEES
jgi:hypothetical protein